jgi:hypothetical protein
LRTFATGARQFVVHEALEMIAVVGLVEVHAEDHGRVGIGRGRRDDHLLGALREMLGGVVALGEEAGRLDDDVDAEIAPRQLSGIALREHLDLAPVDEEPRVAHLHGSRIGPEDRVVAQQVGERARVRQVVDGDPLDLGRLPRVPRHGRAEDVPADPAESVDSHAYRHRCLLAAEHEEERCRAGWVCADPPPGRRAGYQRSLVA